MTTPVPGMPALLEVDGLTVAFRTLAGAVHAVNGLDLDMRAGEIVGLVGESGSGKSVTSRAIMGLLPQAQQRRQRQRPARRQGAGRAARVGVPARPRRAGRDVFQDPLTALDPLYRAGEQVAEALRFHKGLSRPRGTGAGRGAAGVGGPHRARRAPPSSIPTSCRAACASA